MANGTDRWCMAKAKKTKPCDRLVRWRVNLIAGSADRLIDFTLAPDAVGR
jgi:hypothetical protein